MAKRSGVSIKSKGYGSFKGVDFNTDPSLVDDQRSPLSVNMISDEGGNPEKRAGYEVLQFHPDGLGIHNIYGLHIYKNANGSKQFLVHYKETIDTTISILHEDGDITTLASVRGKISNSVFLNGKLFIFTGVKLLVYDGTTLNQAEDIAYVPLTVIGKVPGATPGGVTYEGVNYLSSYQKNSYKGDGTTAAYYLPYTDATSITVWVGGTQKTSGTHYNYSNGIVTFTSGNIPPAPAAGAEDNVVIQFSHTIEGYKDRINKCTNAVLWGVNGASDRIVCYGNDGYPNIDYISGYFDGTYFPDTDYNVVGTELTKIKGYRRIGESLAIIKEDNGQDSSVFIRTSSMDDDGNVYWFTKPCLSGVGGVSEKGFGNINDDQLILTANGVYAITTNTITSEKIAEVRSKYINPKLKQETLSNAICCNFRNMFITFFPNGHAYILDGRQAKSYSSRNETTFNYEGYYWEGLPVNCVMVDVEDGVEQLYFGTSDGRICKLMFDETTMRKYSDGGHLWFNTYERYFAGDGTTATFSLDYEDINSIKTVNVNNVRQTLDEDYTENLADGTITFLEGHIPPAPTGSTSNIYVKYDKYFREEGSAINAVWATKSDDDGDPMILKTMLKKGNAVTLKPFARSSAKVCMRTDKDVVDWQANQGNMDIFSWDDIDFSRFSFNSNDSPREIPFNRKVKNYKRLQIIIRNNVVNEGFGVYKIVKHYVTGNFAKR